MELSENIFATKQLAIVGPGRLGTLLAQTLGLPEPYGRGFSGLRTDGRSYEAVLLCVPDAEIVDAAAQIVAGPLVGHCSGAAGLELLAGHRAFSMHPLMTVTADGGVLAGAGAAIDGTDAQALLFARQLALALGLSPFRILAEDRAAYHAAASIASNFLVTLEAAAEQLAATAGVSHQLLVPLVRATVENWARLGAERALTGPIARGDQPTVARQRQAIAERLPELLPLFDTLAAATASLARKPAAA